MVSAHPPSRRSAALLLAATLLIGVAWILVLPPFEGFDETAHYSSLLEIADRRTVPAYGESRIATIVEQYGAQAPLPYMQQHGVSVASPMSYRDFMQNAEARDAFKRAFASAPAHRRLFEPGASLNWQAQHPPCYYVTLAPLVALTSGLSLVTQLMVLRVASWLMAMAGLAIGVWGTARFIRDRSRATAACAEVASPLGTLPAACLACPFFIPMFVPEFARIGNDALCLLIFGLAWSLLLSILVREPSPWRAAALGACLGAGLLTKALFIPIGAGALACLAWSARRRGMSPAARTGALRDLSIVAAVALLIGAWWYVIAYMRHGALTGSNDLIALSREGGLLDGLREHFEWRYVARGIAAFIVTGYFGGTWTLARLPEWMYAPGLIALAVMCVAMLRGTRDGAISRLVATMLWLLVPLLGGLGYHLLSRIAGGMEGHGTPGWYISILAPACAVPLAAGMIAISRRSRFWWLAIVMWTWMVAFTAAAFWMHAALYAGVAVKDMQTRHLSCPDGWVSLCRAGEIHSRLSVYGWPTPSFLCLGAGAILALLAAHLWLPPRD